MDAKPVDFPTQSSQRRTCIIQIIKIWLLIGLVIIGVIIFVRRSAVTDPQAINQSLAQWVDFSPPDGFYAYRKNHFWGVTAIAFWDKNYANEEGRTTAVIAFVHDKNWSDVQSETWLPQRLKQIEEQFSDIEFKVRAQNKEQLSSDPWDTIYIYSGLQKMDAEMKEAMACYRFIKSSKGVVQAHTLGLQSSFPLEKQLEVLRALRGN